MCFPNYIIYFNIFHALSPSSTVHFIIIASVTGEWWLSSALTLEWAGTRRCEQHHFISLHVTSQSDVVSILCNINALRREDIGDMATIGMSLTRMTHEKFRREPWVYLGRYKAEVPVRAVIMEAYKWKKKIPWEVMSGVLGCYARQEMLFSVTGLITGAVFHSLVTHEPSAVWGHM